MPKVSVIVPFYNREKTLGRCINSILNQSYHDLEIILVNDGSTDSSLQLCRSYEKNDNRVVVVDKIRGGVSSARNAGMDVATGEYITFVDSDDFIDLTMYEKLVTKAVKDNSEFTVCRFSMFDELEQKVERVIQNGLEDLVLKKNVKRFLLGWNNPEFGAANIWVVLFHKNLLRDIRFDEELINEEDSVFFFQTLLKAERCSVLDEYLYYYVTCGNQFIEKYFNKPKYIESRIRHSTILYDLFMRSKLEDEARCVMYQDYYQIVLASCRKERNYVNMIKSIEKKEPFRFESMRKCWSSSKKLVDRTKSGLKRKLVHSFVVNRWFWLIRLYFRLIGKVQIES